MNKHMLLKEISLPLGKARIQRLSALIYEYNFSISDLLNLTFYPQKEVGFRAAWILEYLVLTDLESFRPCVIEFLDRYPRQTNQSCRRHFAKILAFLTTSKCSDHSLIPEHYDVNRLVETTFDWLIDPGTPVAVKVNCMEVLFNLNQHFLWIRDELEAQILFLLHDGQPALQSRGKAILKKLKDSNTARLTHPYHPKPPSV